jgi:hypothetical protein
LKEKILKTLLGMLYFGILNLEASVASSIDDDEIDSLKSELYTPPKAPHFRQVTGRLRRQAKRFPCQITGRLRRRAKRVPCQVTGQLRCQEDSPLPNQVVDILRQPLGDVSRTSIPVAQSKIYELLPRQTAVVLCQLNRKNIINKNTLVVWDVDNALWKECSDLMFSGPHLICPGFLKLIHTTQAKGTTHIALTNGGARYRTQLAQDDEGNWTVDNITPIDFSVADSDMRNEEDRLIPSYLRPRFQDTDRVSWEFLRLEGFKHVGIFLGKAFERSEFLKPRHVLGILKEHNYPFCAPVFTNGVIFSNFINNHMQYLHQHRKGDILRLFLDEYRKKNNQVFSNVVFIDDTFLCVESVFEAMAAIGMPCIGIHILSL